MLKTNIEKLDDVSERYRMHYTKSGDSFILDSELQGEDVTALKNAKQHEKDATTKAKAELVAARADAQARKEAWEIEKAVLQGRTADADKLQQEALDRQKEAFRVQSAAELAEMKGKYEASEKAREDQVCNTLLDMITNTVYDMPSVMDFSKLRERIKIGDDGVAFFTDLSGAKMSNNDITSELKNEEGMERFLRAGYGSGGGARQSGANNGNNNSNKNDEFKRRLMRNDPTLE
jgi:hypothetical protein